MRQIDQKRGARHKTPQKQRGHITPDRVAPSLHSENEHFWVVWVTPFRKLKVAPKNGNFLSAMMVPREWVSKVLGAFAIFCDVLHLFDRFVAFPKGVLRFLKTHFWTPRMPL